MKVLLCGGGNAIVSYSTFLLLFAVHLRANIQIHTAILIFQHVLSAYVSSKPDTNVTVLSLFPGEADKLRDAIPEEGIRCVNDLGHDILGKPNAVIDKVSHFSLVHWTNIHFCM